MSNTFYQCIVSNVTGYLMFGSLQKENISFVSEDSVVLSSGEEEEEKEEETRYMFMCV